MKLRGVIKPFIFSVTILSSLIVRSLFASSTEQTASSQELKDNPIQAIWLRKGERQILRTSFDVFAYTLPENECLNLSIQSHRNFLVELRHSCNEGLTLSSITGAQTASFVIVEIVGSVLERDVRLSKGQRKLLGFVDEISRYDVSSDVELEVSSLSSKVFEIRSVSGGAATIVFYDDKDKIIARFRLNTE